MATRLSISPTYHLSYRLQFSSRVQISGRTLHLAFNSNIPRFGLRRRFIVANSSGGFGEGEDAGDAGASEKRSIAYGLSSRFSQTRRRNEKNGLRKLVQVYDGENWEQLDSDHMKNFSKSGRGENIQMASRVDEYNDRNSSIAGADIGTDYSDPEHREDSSRNNKKHILRVPSRNNLEPRNRRMMSRAWEEQGGEDEEIGGWMGTREPSENFKNSSIYNSPMLPLDNDVKHQRGARTVQYSPLPPPSGVSGNVPKYSRPAHEGTKSSNRKRPKSQYFSPSQSPIVVSSPSQVESELRHGRDNNATFSDFIIPPVIKPELPYQFSYSETPKVAPVGYREPLYSPFGLEGVTRPYLGRPSKMKKTKKLRAESWDSFNSPGANKKGVKPVHRPRPHREGQGPKMGKSRAEILGAPLTDAEVEELVMRCLKEDRQLNLGRDGFTHNMLASIHDYWKRRRVVRIKCKGVPTVDMDNVCAALEGKTGGKIISRAGGVVYLYCGRNYNYKTRPKIPLMLWRPPAPKYPKLIKRDPEGLTVEEADNLRRLGRKLPAICHLGKNGVYLNLVRDVQDAFQANDLVKVDCKRMNTHDLRKIGAKLQDLVPCVLLSFDHECILMWKDPKSLGESQHGVEEDDSGEARPPSRRDGQEFHQYDTDDETDTEGSSIERDKDLEAAYKHDEVQESIHEGQGAGLTNYGGCVSEVEAEEAIKKFESLWQEASHSSDVFILDEREVDPDRILEMVKSHFGVVQGAPAKTWNKINSDEEVGEKTIRSPGLENTVLESLPRVSSGVLQVNELAKLLAP